MRSAPFVFAAMFLAAAFPRTAPAEGKALDEPISKSMTLVERNCTKCHTKERILNKTFTDAEWEAILRRMQVNGAKFDYEEMKALKWYREPAPAK